jgi:hypothetical protein
MPGNECDSEAVIEARVDGEDMVLASAAAELSDAGAVTVYTTLTPLACRAQSPRLRPTPPSSPPCTAPCTSRRSVTRRRETGVTLTIATTKVFGKSLATAVTTAVRNAGESDTPTKVCPGEA